VALLRQTPAAVTVREARAADAAAVARTLTRAFHDDPVQRFLFPGERQYQQQGRANFELVLRRTLEIGVAYTAAGCEGAALWIPPGGDFTAGWRGALYALRSLLAMRTAVRRGGRLFAELARHHPHDAHWYLPVLGTAPEQQGRGVGSAVLAPILARCDAEGLPAYLESSKAKNVAFYQRHGFEVTGKLVVPGGPELWPMLRKPRGPAPV
jgi:ribosomal protein S18 acetylase RimI-like enzyme